MNLLYEKLASISEEKESLKELVSNYEANIAALQQENEALKSQIKALEEKVTEPTSNSSKILLRFIEQMKSQIVEETDTKEPNGEECT